MVMRRKLVQLIHWWGHGVHRSFWKILGIANLRGFGLFTRMESLGEILSTMIRVRVYRPFMMAHINRISKRTQRYFICHFQSAQATHAFHAVMRSPIPTNLKSAVRTHQPHLRGLIQNILFYWIENELCRRAGAEVYLV